MRQLICLLFLLLPCCVQAPEHRRPDHSRSIWGVQGPEPEIAAASNSQSQHARFLEAEENFDAFTTGVAVKIVDSNPALTEIATPSSVYIGQCVINIGNHERACAAVLSHVRDRRITGINSVRSKPPRWTEHRHFKCRVVHADPAEKRGNGDRIHCGKCKCRIGGYHDYAVHLVSMGRISLLGCLGIRFIADGHSDQSSPNLDWARDRLYLASPSWDYLRGWLTAAERYRVRLPGNAGMLLLRYRDHGRGSDHAGNTGRPPAQILGSTCVRQQTLSTRQSLAFSR